MYDGKTSGWRGSRVPLGPLKRFFASGALVRLKPARIVGNGGISWRLGRFDFLEVTPLNAVRCLATLAQLVEQQTENLRVWSSILRGGKF